MSSARFLWRNNSRCLFKPSLCHPNSSYHRSLSYLLHHHSLYTSITISQPNTNNHPSHDKNKNNNILITHQHSPFCSKPPHTNDPNESIANEPQTEEATEEQPPDTTETEESDWEYREVDSQTLKNRNYQILSWRVVIGTIIVFGVGTIIFQQQLHKHRQKQRAPEYASYGEAQIGGGEWKMTDHNNQPVDQTSLIGKYQVVYFGFTFCPDVCPRELMKMAHAMQLLEERGFTIGEDILPVFVSVDPKRDTPALIKKYIRQFHPQIYGLTGSPQQVAKFAKAYKAYFSTPGPGENTDDYIIDHVTMMYVMGRTGEYIGHISTLENADEMANKIAGMIKDVGHRGGFLGTWFKDPAKLIEQKK